MHSRLCLVSFSNFSLYNTVPRSNFPSVKTISLPLLLIFFKTQPSLTSSFPQFSQVRTFFLYVPFFIRLSVPLFFRFFNHTFSLLSLFLQSFQVPTTVVFLLVLKIFMFQPSLSPPIPNQLSLFSPSRSPCREFSNCHIFLASLVPVIFQNSFPS